MEVTEVNSVDQPRTVKKSSFMLNQSIKLCSFNNLIAAAGTQVSFRKTSTKL